MAIRVLVIDDHELVHLGCRSAFDGAGFEVVGTVADADSAIRAAADSAPDVILLDARLGDHDGLAAIPALRAAAPRARIVVFSAFAPRAYVSRAAAAGAQAYVLKSAPIADLIAALARVVDGEADHGLGGPRRSKDSGGALAPGSESGLSSRETGVLRLIAGGRSNLEIAADLGISIETVKEHVQAVLRKTALIDRTQAALWALRHGLT
jgi:DNA-binding NarL/FixJ family response regulator